MRNTIFVFMGLLAGCGEGVRAKAGGGETLKGDTLPGLTVSRLKREMLGKELQVLPKYSGFESRDTVMEGEEEVKWKAKGYYTAGRLIFLAEGDWEDSSRVHRLTVLDPSVKEGELEVGRRKAEIGHLLVESSADQEEGYGLVFYQYKKDSAIAVGIEDSSGKVERIVVMDYGKK